MKGKKLLTTALAVLFTAGIAAPGLVIVHADNENLKLGQNVFTNGDFENLLGAEESEYDLSVARNGVGMYFAGDSHAYAKKEADGNVYLEFKYSTAGFSNIFMTDSPGIKGKVTEGGDYLFSADFKKGENWAVDTDNVGFRFYSSTENGADMSLTAQVNAIPVGEWTRVSVIYPISAVGAPGTDSIQFWCNTMSNPDNVLMMDNISLQYVIPEEGTPEINGAKSVSWTEEEGEDIVFEVDFKGQDLISITDGETEEEYVAGQDYTYSEEDNTLTFDADFLKGLGEGAHEFVIETEGGTVSVVITVYLKVAGIPETTDGYELVPTMKGGDFESYDVGLSFKEEQTEEAWGSLDNYDDPGVIVDDNGNHALKLGRKTGSQKMFSSAFCMTSPEIELGDIVTLKYSYKFVGETPNKIVDSSFTGASNQEYHRIDLVSKANRTGEDNVNVAKWPITFTEGENGYTNVEMSFVVDFAFLNATNSLRFLYQVQEGTDLYIDNVELIRWVEEGAGDESPEVITGTNSSYDASNSQDVTITVELKDYNISNIKLNGATVAASHYSLSADKTTLTISKEYLATLANGEHIFTITTLGGTTTFKITVSNSTVSGGNTPGGTTPGGNTPGGDTDTPKDGNNVGLIVGICAGVAVALIAAIVLIVVLKKKKSAKREAEEQEVQEQTEDQDDDE